MDSNDAGWDRLVDAIDLKFGIKDHGRYQEAVPDRTDLNQSVQFITFDRAGQSFKIERITGPAIIDRKSHYHKAAGQAMRFENIYDPSQQSHKTNFYRQDGEQWQAVNPEELAL
jgi:hypothetical protein